jgi:hypothetical protein
MVWRPAFEAMAPEQEELAIRFSCEIAGLSGGPPSPPDPVRLLEMAQALYEAEERHYSGQPPMTIDLKANVLPFPTRRGA